MLKPKGSMQSSFTTFPGCGGLYMTISLNPNGNRDNLHRLRDRPRI
jgi:hypothetical protein